MKEIKAWRCEWCKKISPSLAGIKAHERSCHLNPDFNCCENCKSGILKALSTEPVSVRDKEFCELWDISELPEQFSPFCLYHNCFIFATNKDDNAYFIECETYDNSCGEHDEVPIPYTCFGFESKGTHGYIHQSAEDINEGN